MERAEKQGLAVAAVGHAALFALLSLGLFQAKVPKPPLADTMDVTIADQVSTRSAAPQASEEAPAPSEAPDQGTPEDAAPPPPAPEPAPLPPRPAPPKPSAPKPTPPEPRPTPPKPEPKPVPKPEPKPVPKPESKPLPKPKPVEKPPPPKPEKAKPVPEKPAKPEKAKPTPEKAAKSSPEKAAPSRTDAKPAPAKKAPGLSSDFLTDLPKDSGSGKSGEKAKPKGSRLGSDFLKGLSPDKSAAKGAAPHAAVSAQSMAGVGALIKQQVKPNYNPPTGGADAAAIKSTLQITMARDGTVRDVQVVGHQGVNGTNSAYVKQADDAAVRAVKRSSPLHLPPDLYDGGWQNITLNFSGAQLQ